MLKVMRKEGRTVPLACCHVCGSWIDEASLGAAVFASLDREGETQAVQLVHKGACHDIAEAKLRAQGSSVGWLELKRYFSDLLHNSGFPLEKQLQMQADDEKFGRL